MEKNKTVICDACGSQNVHPISQLETRQLTLGPEFSYHGPRFRCDVCGEEGDFANVADQIHEAQHELARKSLASTLIDAISNTGMRLAHIERAFELPQRTIASKWKTGSVTASGLALLRVVYSMPWVVNVADNRFSDSSIQYEVTQAFQCYAKKQGFTFSKEYGHTNEIKVRVFQSGDDNAFLVKDAIEVGPIARTGAV
jgi:hypothetical protein